MGLDMYLTGCVYFTGNHPNLKEKPPLVGSEYELAYWRKSWDLHGHIIKTYAGGVDNCQDICLGLDDLREILEYSKDEKIASAIKWLEAKEPDTCRAVVYMASW